MSTIVTKSLEFTKDNSSTYASGSSGCECPGGDCFARQYLSSDHVGYATLKDAAKNILYPTATAKPFKADSYMRASRNIGSTAKFELQFGGTAVHSVSTSSTSYNDYNKNNMTDGKITESTRSTAIRYRLEISNAIYGARLLRSSITLYFYQYACAAQKGNVSGGISSVSCSNTSPYQGDPVEYDCVLKGGATFGGWYSDAACTQLVSSSQKYSTTASKDQTLYAKAEAPSGTQLYVKENGQAQRVMAAYQKQNGIVVDVSSQITELLNTGHYYKKR